MQLYALFLKILQKFLPNLPRDPRTFLKATKDVSVLPISGGVFYNFDIKKPLEMILKEFNLKDEITFSLQFNIDGLSLHKSTGKQFWPILVRIVSPFKSKISTIGVYYGKSKPSNLEFLNEFIQELKDLLSNGIAFNGKNLGISLFCFSADAPARAFLKCIISHNGYYGCEKCETKGEYVLNRVSFPETDANLRTDSSFRQMLQPEHYNAVSPFVDFVNMVTEFPYDYMHLVCLGVMKRLLLIWINGPQATRLTKACVMNISNRLLEMKECVTTDFSRKPRGLQDIHYWKATEFRLFLLYLGPVVLKYTLSKYLFDHFLLLHSAIFILVDPLLCSIESFLNLAENLLIEFVKSFKSIYVFKPVIYNIHSLLHLVNDCRMYIPLDRFSCFLFESYLGCMKKMVKGSKNPLVQVANRLSELNAHSAHNVNSVKPMFSLSHVNGPIAQLDPTGLMQYQKFTNKKFCISVKKPDNCIQFEKSIGLVKNIVVKDNIVYVVLQIFLVLENLYTTPCASSKLGAFVVRQLDTTLTVIKMSDVVKKYILISSNNKNIVLPLHHVQ